MTANDDNAAGVIPGTIRDPITAANILRVNADGSINASVSGIVNGFVIPYGNLGGPPLSSTFSWVNQGSATIAQAGGVNTPLMLTLPNDSALNWRGRFVAQPSTPYTLYALIRTDQLWSPTGSSYAAGGGVYFYDGTKLMGLEFINATVTANPFSYLRVEKINNVTTDGSTAASRPASVSSNLAIMAPYGGVFIRLKNDGSTLTFSYSMDGWNFVDLFSEAIGTFITPTQIGFAAVNLNAPGSITTSMWVLSWKAG